MTAERTAIITGGGTGVGAATALRMADLGYRVVVNYSRSAAEAAQVVASCQARGAEAMAIQGSVAEDADCQRIAHESLARFGRIDVLVNSAGVTNFAGLSNWDALDAAEFQRIYAVNAVGAFQMVRACVAALRASKGSIVNVSSMAGVKGSGSSVPYLMSKGALNTLTLHLARQLAPEIRVNAVCPGLISSDWFAKGVGAEGAAKIEAHWRATAPLQEVSSPDDVAEAVVWFAHGARTTTGNLFHMDAGMNLGAKR